MAKATSKCQAVQVVIDEEDERSITLVDTPGFDDTTRSRGEILNELTEYLSAQHALNIPLLGILYLHKITDNRMTGSSLTYLRLFESLVGQDAMKNVVLVTTMWNKVRDEDIGEALRREQELFDNYWRSMEDKGSYLASFDGSTDSALALILQLSGNDGVVLDIQKEIVEQDRDVLHTSAGQNLLRELHVDREGYEIKLKALSRQVQMEKQQGSTSKVKAICAQQAEVEAEMKKIEESIRLMVVKPRSRIRERIERVIASKGMETTISILAGVLNITLFIVKITTGG